MGAAAKQLTIDAYLHLALDLREDVLWRVLKLASMTDQLLLLLPLVCELLSGCRSELADQLLPAAGVLLALPVWQSSAPVTCTAP